MADGIMDESLLNGQGPLSEREVEGQGMAEELPTSEGNHSGASCCDSQVESHRSSSGSHDFEDDHLNAQYFCIGPAQASENSNLIVDTIQSESDSREGESTFIDPKWLEHDEFVALWVKVSVLVYYFSLLLTLLPIT